MPNNSKAPRILIVDDDSGQRSLLDSFLKSQGFDTLPVSSGERALEILRAEEFSMMISDVRMPGMNGIDLQHQIVEANWRIPIIFITSHADDDARTRALKAGAVAFLYKPFREEELLDALDAALKHS